MVLEPPGAIDARVGEPYRDSQGAPPGSTTLIGPVLALPVLVRVTSWRVRWPSSMAAERWA